MLFTEIPSLFHVDILSIIMICLVGFIGFVVCLFSNRYMKGDAIYQVFFRNVLSLIFSVSLISITDNLLLFLIAWGCCNLFLTKLMVHKSSWAAARASARLAVKNFIVGFSFISLAFVVLYKQTGSTSIQHIVHNTANSSYTLMALLMLLIGAMTQSALWPFHRWLTSSLNSPTPVSALMHAGVVNGGGFLLVRFAPLYFNAPKILEMMVVVGLISVLLGSLWKLIQSDVKRMLACSTMGQMGFMFVQFGLGFFASGIAHLCCHGLFKAYLFLASGSAAQEKRFDLVYNPSISCFILSLGCGFLASYIFAVINHINLFYLDTYKIIVLIVFISGVQVSLATMRAANLAELSLSVLLTAIMAVFYGANFYFFDYILSPLSLMQPQSISIFHIITLIMLAIPWLLVLCFRSVKNKDNLPNWLVRIYVQLLNNSQPHPDTITAYRKGYNYV